MSTFLYFIPGNKRLPHDQKKEGHPIDVHGLRDMIGYKNIAERGVHNGPGGSDGCIIAREMTDGSPNPRHGYYPDRQEWKRIEVPVKPDEEPLFYYIGYDKEVPPTAKGLQKPVKELIDGHLVELEGGKYMIPTARVFPEGTRLPNALVLGPDGTEWTREPLQEYVEYSKKAEKYWHTFLVAFNEIEEIPEDMQMTEQELIDFAVEALCMNHYLRPIEVSFGRIIRDTRADLILEAIVDGPEIKARNELLEAEVKKKEDSQESDSPPIDSGETED